MITLGSGFNEQKLGPDRETEQGKRERQDVSLSWSLLWVTEASSFWESV